MVEEFVGFNSKLPRIKKQLIRAFHSLMIKRIMRIATVKSFRYLKDACKMLFQAWYEDIFDKKKLQFFAA